MKYSNIILTTLLFSLFTGLSYSQTVKSKVELPEGSFLGDALYPDLKKDGTVFPVFNQDSSNFVLLISSSNYLSIIYLDSQFNQLNFFETELPATRELSRLDGGFYGDGYFYAVFTDNKKANFSIYKIDPEVGTIYSTNFHMYLEKEKYLHSFAAGDYYYVVSVPIYSSQVVVNRINDQLRVRNTAYDFSDVAFDSTNPTLFKEINEYIIKGNHRLSKISMNDPVTTAATSSFFKAYHDDKVLRLTFDHVIGLTTILEVELNSKLKNAYQVNAPDYVLRSGYSFTSNSYLIENTLINLIAGDNGIGISFHDIATGDLLEEINLNKNEDLEIINKPVTIEGKPYYSKQIQVKDFIKLIEGKKLGVAANQLNENTIEVSFGAAKTPERDLTDQLLVGIGLEDVEETVSPTYLAYTNNELSKLTNARGLFDISSFEHIEGDLHYTIYDEIDDYRNRRYSGFEVLESLFQIGNAYFLGAYYPPGRKYQFIKFELHHSNP